MQRAALGAAIVTTALALGPRASAAQQPENQATAEQGGEQVRLVYEDSAPADCPSQAEFESEVTKLTSKAHFTDQLGSRQVRIELASRGSDVLGRLITDDGNNQSSREVRGKDCREVSSALAMAVALTIDPDALGPELPDVPELRKDAAAPGEPPEKQERLRPPPQPVPERPSPAALPRELLLGLGVGLTLESAWAPQIRPGPHAYALLGIGDRWRFSLGVTRFFRREADSLSFGAWLGQGSISWNLAVLGVLRPFALLGYEAGVIASSGSGLATSSSALRPWQAASAGLGLRFESEDVFLQIGGSLLVPISRQRYVVSNPEREVTTLYETSRFGLKQETSLGVFL